MKRKIIKILGVALTIALIASLFVFAAPISAKNNPKFITDTTTYTITSQTIISMEPMGNDYMVRFEMISTYSIDGYFGLGTAIEYAHGVLDLITGEANFTYTMEVTYAGGGLTLHGVGWRIHGPYEGSRWTIISGTDAYANLHGHGTTTATATGNISTGTYHYAP